MTGPGPGVILVQTVLAVSRWPWIALVLLAGAAPGCSREWHTTTATPPIILGAGQEARTSLPAVILLGDMELPHSMRLVNSAYFVAVSRDRLRFHVTLHHKWEDMTDPTRWRVWLEDDLGRRFVPAAVDRRHIDTVTEIYDPALPNQVNLLPLYSFTVYRGQGDYTFYVHDLVRKDMRWVMLVMQRPGYEFRYRWSFVADPDAPARPVRGAALPAIAARASTCASVRTPCPPLVALP